MPKKYTPELRERVVRMVLERHAAVGGPRSHSIRAIAAQVGVSAETLGAVVQPALPRGRTNPCERESAGTEQAPQARAGRSPSGQ